VRSPVVYAIYSIIRAELLLNFRRPAPWVLLMVFVANAILWATAGPAVSYGWATNSDFYIARLYGGFSFLTLPFFNAMLMGDPIIRDFRLGVDPLLLSKPVSRAAYLLGKFMGNFLTLVLCMLGFGVTIFLLQWYQAEKMIVLPWRVTPYVVHFFVLVVVSQLALASFCFTVGTLTRNARLVYGLVALLYVLTIALMGLIQTYLPGLRAIIEPVLFDWLNRVSRGRSAASVNQYVIVYGFNAIANRLLMIGVSAACLIFLCLRFGRETAGAPSEEKATATSILGLREQQTERLYNEEGAVAFGPSELNEVARVERPVVVPSVAVSTAGLRVRISQLVSATSLELRLLIAERSLIILAPLVVIAGGLFLESFSGPFNAPLFPLSSIYATNSAAGLLVALFGVIVFFTGEAIHRDREMRVEDMLWVQPAPDWTFLLSKFASSFVLSLTLIILSFLTAVAVQLIKGLSPVEISPYLIIYSVILLPSVAFMIAAAIALNVLLRNKYLAHATGIAAGGGLLYLLQQGYANWLYNPVLYGLWAYSDMTGLEPYQRGIMLHRIYWGAITVGLLSLAHAFFRRGPSRARRLAVISAGVSIILAGISGAVIYREVERGPDSKSLEAARAGYEKEFSLDFRDAPQPHWSRVDLRVELYPSEHSLRASGSFKLENRSPQPLEKLLVSLDSSQDWNELSVEGATDPPRAHELGRVFKLDPPMMPGESRMLRAEWGATIPRGINRGSSVYMNFIMEGGTLLGGPDFTEWLPMIGYLRKWEISDPSIRGRYDLPERNTTQNRDATDGFPVKPFDLHIEITVPRDQTALSSGRLVDLREGEKKTFVYETETAVSGIVIACAPYAEERRGGLAVFYHPAHRYNVASLLDAMEAAREKYERDYGPSMHSDLRIAEFPGLARFAISHATTIPCSENLVFVAREDESHVNVNYFAAAHEIAHQWFGHRVVAAQSPGSGVLLEGLAEYAAGALIDEALGKEAAQRFRRFEETAYIRNRAPDSERPLALVDGSRRTDGVLVYQKAGLVFHMLERLIGRERMNAALREYVARFAGQALRPTLDDLVSIFKKHSSDLSLDWFYDEWFYRVVVPDFQIVSAVVKNQEDGYLIEYVAANAGGGRIPVTIEAVAGSQGDGGSFKSVGVTVLLEGAEAKGVIRCPFKPERVVIDRTCEVIDLDRANNEHRF
jgi:ABC-type transport system involved in multi-copper enzyme maturation permease subunit